MHEHELQLRSGWLAQKPWIVPIPGTTKVSRLEENIGSAELVLQAQDLADIQKAAAQIQIEGERYPAHLMAMVGR